MRRLFTLLLFCCSFCALSYAQEDSIRQRIYLIGDAGELEAGTEHPVIDWLKKNVDWNDIRNTAIYLGDNVYPLGLPMEGEPGYAEAKKVLDYEISLVKGKKAHAYFIMGNHDWMNGMLPGWQRAQNQTNYINRLGEKNIQAWPLYGCPGPVEVELDEKVVIIFADSQWFLHVHDKPGFESNCNAKTVDEFIAELQEIADRHPNQLLVLAMHHPLYTRGSHGGNYTWKQHLFPLAEAVPGLYIPLPVIGSVYPLTRGVFGNLQDVNHPLYRNMAKQIEVVLKSHPNAIQVAGHDHNLQMLVKDSIPYVISGSASKLNRVDSGLYTRFEEFAHGFAMLEVRKSGKAWVKFYDLTSPNLDHPRFTYNLKDIVTPPPAVAAVDTLAPLPAQITVAANKNIKTSGRKPKLYGWNYRTEWVTPVTVPVFDIKKEQGGLTTIRKTGSAVNKKLLLTDPTGKEWTLHSLAEYPRSVVPPDLVSPFVKDTVSDILSATYPYAALSIAPMEKALGLPTIERKLVYVPDDPRLGRYRSQFSSTMAVLEEDGPPGIKQTYNTDKLIQFLASDNTNRADQHAVLKARLLDNFIMDFERQEDQWLWATRDTSSGRQYYPLSLDHNQAFFVNEGLIPHLLRRPSLVPEIQGFRPKAYNIRTFNRMARNFDYFFLNSLDREQWNHAIDTFLNAMTDEVITRSLQQQPAEIRGISADKIANTLKQRRDFFRKDMLFYYELLAQKVDVVGSDARERFTVTKNPDGHVQVVINKLETGGVPGATLYNRTFDPKETRELRLYGLGDDDVFSVQGGTTPIKVRLIGGPGNDSFAIEKGGGKVKLYDANFEKNVVTGNGAYSDMRSMNPLVNQYNRLSFKYDNTKLGPSFGLNTVDLLMLGLKFQRTKQGFRKDPYGMRHLLAFNHSFVNNSYQARYEGDFMEAIANSDLLIRAGIRAMGNTNFFGLGNNTVFTGGRSELKYYRAKYDMGEASLLLRKRLQSWMSFSYGPTFEYFRVYEHDNEGKFVSQAPLGSVPDHQPLYQGRTFAGALARLNIDSRNNPILPTRGFTLEANVRPLFGVNANSYNLTQADLTMATFISLFNYPRFVLAIRAGYGHNFGDYAFPQAQYLSGNVNLRGYRWQRFAGRTAMFNNTELRFRIADFKVYLLPGSFGILAFHDIGRVKMENENSHVWHTGYGGGLWLSPIKRFVLTGTVGFSKEESLLPVLKIGFLF